MALKKYKMKFEKSKTLLQLREHKSFTKPPVKRSGSFCVDSFLLQQIVYQSGVYDVTEYITVNILYQPGKCWI